jgi:hypothetical protein
LSLLEAKSGTFALCGFSRRGFFSSLLGGPLSPLLANVALHGLETVLRQAAPAKSPPGVIRYADDFVVLYHDLDTLHHLKTVAAEWLAEIGLQLHPEKILIIHTLELHGGRIGSEYGGQSPCLSAGRQKPRSLP